MDNNQTPAYKAGYILGGVIVGCVITIILALTVKFIMWLF